MKIYQLSEDVRSLFTAEPDVQFQKVGSGNNRVVYQIQNTERYNIELNSPVIKVEPTGVENEREHSVWKQYRNTALGEHLVPIKHQSPDYEWIMMPYYEPVEPSEVNADTYERLVNLGSDISKTDFVQDSNGEQYCCDYASILDR